MFNKTILLTTCLFQLSYGLFNFPDNINFDTQIYSSNNCANGTNVRNLSLSYMCFDTSDNHSYPQCCMDLLEDIYIPGEPIFDKCILTTEGSIRYKCDTTHFNHFTTEEVISYMGLVLIIINSLLLTFCVAKYCCCPNNNKRYYNRW